MTAEDGVQTIAQFIGSSAGFLSLLAERIKNIANNSNNKTNKMI